MRNMHKALQFSLDATDTADFLVLSLVSKETRPGHLSSCTFVVSFPFF